MGTTAHLWKQLSRYVFVALLVGIGSGCVQGSGGRQGRHLRTQQPTFSKLLTLRASELDSKYTARTQALAQVHIPLIDEMITLLEVTPAISQMQLSHDQLVMLGCVVAAPEIEDESWDGSTYVLRAKITVMPPEVIERLKRVREDSHTVRVIERARESVNTALQKLALARREFSSNGEPHVALRWKKLYDEQIQVLSAMQGFIQGLRHANAQNYTDAVIAFSAVIERSPQNAEAYNQRALAYVALGQPQQALEDVTKALELKSEEAQYFVVRGLVYEDLNDTQRAIEDFTHALQIDPQRVSAYMGRARVLEGMRKYDQALADFSRVLDLEPHRQVAYYNRGTLYSEMGQYERAIADFSRALELAPNDAKALNNRGALYGILGDHEQSVQDFTRVISLQPQQAKAYLNRAISFEKLGNYPQAIQDYSKALAMEPEHDEVYFNRGMAYIQNGEYTKAVQDLNRVVERQPTRAEAHYSLASAYKQLDRPEEALAHYREAARLELQALLHDAQEQLKAAGFDPGPVDGVMGQRTEAALRQYQQTNGLSVTGTFDDTTLRRLFIDSSFPTGR